MSDEIKNEIVKLQETITYQAMEISALSDEVFQQQKQILSLRNAFERLQVKFENLKNNQNDAEIKPLNEETKPPHY
jgi:uncharacterized coiled-coil protein SlyX